jgi:SAM-dependent methyltransferase
VNHTQEPLPYTGVENLEVMAEAHNYNAWLVRMVLDHVQPGARVLDFGAGSGTFADLIRRSDADVTCIEPDQTLRLILQRQGFITYAEPSAMPADQQFDVIYSLNVLEHIEDDRAAVRTLAGRVCPGGVLLIYVPAFDVLYTAMDRRVGHVRRYRLRALTDLVRGAGLQVVKARYVDCLGFAATLTYRLLGDRTGAINPRALKLYDRLIFPISHRLDRLFGRLFGKNALVVSRRVGGLSLAAKQPGSSHHW